MSFAKLSLFLLSAVLFVGSGQAFCCVKRGSAPEEGEENEAECPEDYPYTRPKLRSCSGNCTVLPNGFLVMSGSVAGLCCEGEIPSLGSSFVPECDEELPPTPQTPSPTMPTPPGPTSAPSSCTCVSLSFDNESVQAYGLFYPITLNGFVDVDPVSGIYDGSF